ncbi:MAG: YkgJ family cysteine cluster protein [Crenarchaeota archaeon]|nr:YkgJ family cysteine cluster protein [Thermoproteota archaeon]
MRDLLKRCCFDVIRGRVSIHVDVKRYLKDCAPFTEIYVNVRGSSLSFDSFSRFFDFIERSFGRDVLNIVDEFLDKYDLCVRCGLCCVNGAPCITLEDAALMMSSSYRDVIVNYFSKISDINIVSDVQLFVIWNAHVRFLRPCPFLGEEERCVTRCVIYPVRPSFCRLFKCWSSLSDLRRKEHVMLVLSQLRRCSVDGSLEKFREHAIRNVEIMYSYLF